MPCCDVNFVALVLCWVCASLDPTYFLVRLKAISPSPLRHRLEQAWRFRAPKRLASDLDAKR
jgi:hypothetical protein